MSDDQHIELEEQEREEILEEIDKLVADNRLPVSEAIEKLKPQKSGAGFPLLINLFAVAAVLSTFYFSNRLFEQKQETLSLENATYQSAEGKLLEELKKESAQQLEKKEQEIGVIQNELAELDRQSRQLIETMDQQIAAREEELRLALEEELENERRKLRSQGKSEADIMLELEKIEEQKSAEYEAELASFRDATEKKIAAREEELALARQLNQELLAEVNSEKERIRSETKKRETELTAKFEAEKAALAEEAASAEAELEKLTGSQARESLIIDQINSSYESIFNSINNNDFTRASQQIDSLKKLIEDPAVAQLKAVGARSGNDRNILEMLQQRIEEQSYKEDTSSKSLAAAAELLLSAQEISELGTEAYNDGRFSEARQYYIRSLDKIPAIRQAWKNLEGISVKTEAEQLSQMLSTGDTLAAEGRQAEAFQQYTAAAAAAATANPDLLRKALTGMTKSSEAVRAFETGERDIKIASLEDQSSAEINRLNGVIEENERSYTSELSRTNVEWEQKLSDADTAYKNLAAENNEEIERLTKLIGERDQENLRINSEKEDLATSLTFAREEITALNTRIEELQNLSETEISQLSSESEAEIEQIRSEAEAEITRLGEELSAAEQKYRELNENYSSEQTVSANRLRASEITGYNNGIKQGRTDAFNSIIEFTSYLDGTAALTAETESRISDLAADDPDFGKAVQKIQQLAASGSEASAAGAVQVKQNILIGTISYASDNSITIEPLSDAVIEPGTRITIYRKQRGKEEYYITFGVVTSANEDRISARTDPSGTVQAQSMDLVYILE